MTATIASAAAASVRVRTRVGECLVATRTMMTSLPPTRTRHFVCSFVVCLALGVILEAAKIKVRAEADPGFDFATVHTWAWDDEAGKVLMARFATDDPAPLKARIDPLIRQYVSDAMAKKGLAPAVNVAPDVQLHYYVLVSLNVGGHEMGQFLPSVPYWGLPPFPPATTSLNAVTKGSLVLDAMLPGTVGERRVVWRGVAQSTVADDDSPEARQARLREAADELVKRFPVKRGAKRVEVARR